MIFTAYLFRNVLSFFSRMELFELSIATKYFYKLIQREFKTVPYLVLSELRFDPEKETGCTYHPNASGELQPILVDFLSRLQELKYLRVESFRLKLGPQVDLIEFLKPIKHLWQDQKLLIIRVSSIEPTAELALLISTCRQVAIIGAGSMGLLNHIELMSSKCVEIHDKAYSPDVKLPMQEMTKFLCRSVEYAGSILISTKFNTSFEQYNTLISTISQKFLVAPVPPKLQLQWRHRESVLGEEWEGADHFELSHPRSKIHLFHEFEPGVPGFLIVTGIPIESTQEDSNGENDED
ncbi:hypothetical protein DdX_19949 [Ditylenchus destructor]|uniref:F-box domain-containing protein n=1 Tax=Ditylenchus destructor TaxID=166010 RepID=A0AAD4MIN0_9BILA|nr:hypothetical protein DdX_19949 [Ditylenchus destructor]